MFYLFKWAWNLARERRSKTINYKSSGLLNKLRNPTPRGVPPPPTDKNLASVRVTLKHYKNTILRYDESTPNFDVTFLPGLVDVSF